MPYSIRTVLRREVFPVCIAYALVGLSFGALAASTGVPGWVAPVMSATVFAGSAQFAALGIVLGGGGILAAGLAAVVINTRLFAYGLAIGEATGRHGISRWLAAHLITDVNTALVLPEPDPDRRRRLFRSAGIAIFLTWTLSTSLGVWLGDRIHDIHAFGLDAVLPVILFALVRTPLRDRLTRHCAFVGSLLAILTVPILPAGWPVLVSLAGCGVLLFRRERAAS